MVNVGIIGAGRIGKVHVESICTQVKDAKVKMLADPFMNDETAKWAKDMGVEAVTKDYIQTLYLIFDYPYKYYTFKHFEV